MSKEEIDKITQALNDMKTCFEDHIEKHDKHIDEMQPILDAYKGAGTIGKLVIWVSKVVVAFTIVAGAFWGIIHFK